MGFTAYCYVCKRHITTPDQEEFSKSGHVFRRQEAWNVYRVHTNRLPRDSELPPK